MKEQTKAQVEIAVFDYKGELQTNVQVTLQMLEQEQAGTVHLRFDPLAGAYRAIDVDPGYYMLRAEVNGLAPDEREVQVAPGGLSDTVILGQKELPFYYRGKVKVPFEPHNDLLGVSLQPGLSGEAEEKLLDFARQLKLKPEQVGEPIRQDLVRVFSFPARITEMRKQEIQRRLADNPMVRLVGPIIRIDSESVSFLTNEVIVKFEPQVSEEEAPLIAGRYKLEILRKIPYAGNAYLLRTANLASYDLLQICADLVSSGLVEYAEPNLVVTAVDDAVNPTDFLFSQQWHLPYVHLPDAWQTLRNANPAGVLPGNPGDLTFGSERCVIAVMDSGIQSTLGTPHPDFNGAITSSAAKVYQYWDFVNMVPDNNASPTISYHGTSCAGVAAALTNNTSVVPGENEGVAGAAGNCRVMGLIRPSGGTELNYSDAYIWASGFNPNSGTPAFPTPISPGADIITNSFGASVGSPISGLMKDCFDYLTSYGRGGAGVLLFFSAGNANVDFRLQRPWAAYEKTIAVAASTDGDVKAGYSNFGPGIDVCAPSNGGANAITTSTLIGTGNLTGHTGGSMDYQNGFGGTSSATPLTAGVAALMLSIDSTLTWVEVRQILRDTATKIDAANTDPTGRWQDINGHVSTDPGYLGPNYSQWYGFGRIDAQAAVVGSRDYGHNRDIVVRENLADVGTVPSPGWFADSPDIWVRNVSPAVDGAAALPANYGSLPPHQNAISGTNNWVYMQFKNVGSAPSYDFYVRVYIAHFPGTEFVYPTNFIPTNGPGAPVTTPMQPGTYLIGEFHYAALAAGTSDIINVMWPSTLIPPQTVLVGGISVTWHPCLLVEISPHDGPSATGPHVWDDNNIAQKNITIVYADADNSFAVGAVLGNAENRSNYLDLVIDRSDVPSQVRLFAEFADANVRERLLEFIHHRKRWPENGSCQITLLEEARVLVECSGAQGSGHMVMTLPAKTHLEMPGETVSPDDPRYNFTLGEYQDREVIWLAPQGQTRIPVFADTGSLTLLTIGGVIGKGAKPGDYEIRMSQYNSDGQPSGGLSVQLKAGQRKKRKQP